MPDRDLALLLEAAEAAGAIALRHFGRAPDVWEKAGGAGPVTAADIEIDRMLRGELRAARPDYGWLSEESEDGPARLEARRVFVVDPLDGTRAFINGEPTFSHSLAIVEDGRPLAGAVHLPKLGRTYAATAEGGAFRNGTPIVASARSRLEGARLLAPKANLAPAFWPGGVPPVERHFRTSIAYRLCLAAEGRFDAMVTLKDTWEWDIAAGSLIAAAAGARVTSRDGQPLGFNNPVPRLPGVVAAGPALHAALMARLLGREPASGAAR